MQFFASLVVSLFLCHFLAFLVIFKLNVVFDLIVILTIIVVFPVYVHFAIAFVLYDVVFLKYRRLYNFMLFWQLDISFIYQSFLRLLSFPQISVVVQV
jgi:hypothetical protein